MAEPPTEIDYLNDPLLAVPIERERAARTPLLDQAVEVLEGLNSFFDIEGREPSQDRAASVVERMLFNDLAGLRASKASLSGLETFDVHGLVFKTGMDADPMDDPLLAEDTDIFQVREILQTRAATDYIADRRPCPDFDRFEALFDAVRDALDAGTRKPVPFHQERVDLEEFFALKGQLIHVAEVRDAHQRNGREDARLRVIFDNGTESNLLMSSLVRRLYEDKDARRIPTKEVGPLFEGARTGFVYVLRSKSEKPEVVGLLKVGTTAGSVEDRIERAETQATYLFAEVTVVDTYELVGYSAKEAERLLHRQLARYHVGLKVTGADGRVHKATEWFKVDPDTVADSLTACFGRKIRTVDG